MEEGKKQSSFLHLSPSILHHEGSQSQVFISRQFSEKPDENLKDMKGSNNNISKWYNSMQSAFEADMHELRATLQNEYANNLELEKKKYAEELDQLKDTLAKVQAQMAKLSKQMEWKKASMKALCDQCVYSRHLKIKSALYLVWREKWLQRQVGQWKCHIANACHQKMTQRKVFWSLRNSVVVPWKQTFEKKIRNEAEACIAATSQKYEAKIAELSAELIQLEKVRREEELRMKHKEEETRKAFLRGLSILNMETMAVLKQHSDRETHDHTEGTGLEESPLEYTKDIDSMYRASLQALSPLCSEFPRSPVLQHALEGLVPSVTSMPHRRGGESAGMAATLESSLYQEMQSALLPPHSPFSASVQRQILTSPTHTRAHDPKPPHRAPTKPSPSRRPITLPASVSARGIGHSVYVTRHPPPPDCES